MTVMENLLTIVRYDPECRPEDRYPREIISPANRSPCCSERMERIGKMQVGEAGWPFFYKRCQICGYAVREFLGYEELTEYFLKGHNPKCSVRDSGRAPSFRRPMLCNDSLRIGTPILGDLNGSGKHAQDGRSGVGLNHRMVMRRSKDV